MREPMQPMVSQILVHAMPSTKLRSFHFYYYHHRSTPNRAAESAAACHKILYMKESSIVHPLDNARNMNWNSSTRFSRHLHQRLLRASIDGHDACRIILATERNEQY